MMDYLIGILILIIMVNIVIIKKLYDEYKDYKARNELLKGENHG